MKTIAAIATPLAVGGISVIRLSGEEAISLAEQIFQPVSGKKLSQMEGYTAAYGDIISQGNKIDDGVALVYRAPKSYTGENVVEISCHGGLLVSRNVLRAALEAGAAPAQNGEFTKRAFLNGKMGLTQAEAVMDIINAQSDQAVKSAKTAMEGALYQSIRSVCDQLVAVAGHLSAWVDYPEEEIEQVETEHLLESLQQAESQMKELLEHYDVGRIIREGIETAIVGKPNVGKSTLMNLMSGVQKSIVTDIAGTTRDVVEETVDIGGVILRLADTAGIRDTQDVVEQIGVDMAKKRMLHADLVLAMFDCSEELSDQDKQLIEELRGLPVIAVVNKTDLEQKLDTTYLQQHFQRIVFISAKNTDGIDQLKQTIFSMLELEHIDGSSPMIANERQKNCAQQAYQMIQESIATLQAGFTLDAVTVSIESAIEALLELTGERVTDAVVDEVFSHFCVGK